MASGSWSERSPSPRDNRRTLRRVCPSRGRGRLDRPLREWEGRVNRQKGGEMRRFGLVAAAVAALAVAPAASLATPTGSVTFPSSGCTTGDTTFAASISVYPASAFNPLIVTNTDSGTFAGILIP